MFEQGPAATADSHPSGAKKLREDTDKDEDSGFNLGKIVQALETFPARVSSRQSPALQGVGSGVAMRVHSARVSGPRALSMAALGLALLSRLLCGDLSCT